jgi:hypothetical protein
MVPGRSPPLITWQVRQLPLPRSNAIFWPSLADWARAGPDKTAAPISNASAQISMGFVEGVSVKGASCKLLGYLTGL